MVYSSSAAIEHIAGHTHTYAAMSHVECSLTRAAHLSSEPLSMSWGEIASSHKATLALETPCESRAAAAPALALQPASLLRGLARLARLARVDEVHGREGAGGAADGETLLATTEHLTHLAVGK